MKRLHYISGLVAVLLVIGLILFLSERGVHAKPLRVGIAPYQDLAMLVNAQPLGLDKRYGTELELLTMAWEDILPAVASAGQGLDVGFGSYVEFLTKENNINSGSSDPVMFIYPAYVFKGGAFVTFEAKVPVLDKEGLNDPSKVRVFLGLRIGAQRGSVYEMMLYYLAHKYDVPIGSLHIVDTPLDQGFLAAKAGSVDVAEAGLTQLTETHRLGGKSVLNMEDLGFADITGFIVKKSIYEARRTDIENLIKIWFDCAKYVLADIPQNSTSSLEYLNKNASTHYTLSEYEKALSQEYFPLATGEANRELISDNGRYSYKRIGVSVQQYLLDNKIISAKPPLPNLIHLQ